MNFQKENNLVEQNELEAAMNQYAMQLNKMKLIPTSDFLLSTINFWNNITDVHFFYFENSILLVQLNPPFGEAFGYLLCINLSDDLLQSCKAEIAKLGINKFKIFCPNISENNMVANYKLIEERDEFEYIYNLQDIALLQGSKYKKQRNAVAKAIKENLHLSTEILDLNNVNDLNELKLFCEDCMLIKSEKSQSNETNLQKEWLAFQKCLDMKQSFHLKILKLYVNKKLSGLMIYEQLNNELIVGHFFKTYHGLGIYLLKELATQLTAQNFKYFNFQEDRGVESLRYFKQQLNPAFYLKTYSIAFH